MAAARSGRIAAGLAFCVALWVIVYWAWPTSSRHAAALAEGDPFEQWPEPGGVGGPGDAQTPAVVDPLAQRIDDGSPAIEDPTPGRQGLSGRGDASVDPPLRIRITPPEGSGPQEPLTPPEFDAYTVQRGDTFSSIALAAWGDATLADRISRANPMVDPLRIRPGMELRLPRDPDNITGRRDGDGFPPTAVVTEYIVEANETFSDIAKKVYGSARHWTFLFEANRDRVRGDPRRLRVGQAIVVPPLPAGE